MNERGAVPPASGTAPRPGGAVPHAEWLSNREPIAPADLVARVRVLLEANPALEQAARADAFIEASELLLKRVLHGDQHAAARRNAIDLLAADACVTYAFEAAAEDGADIAALSQRAMARIAAIAQQHAE